MNVMMKKSVDESDVEHANSYMNANHDNPPVYAIAIDDPIIENNDSQPPSYRDFQRVKKSFELQKANIEKKIEDSCFVKTVFWITVIVTTVLIPLSCIVVGAIYITNGECSGRASSPIVSLAFGGVTLVFSIICLINMVFSIIKHKKIFSSARVTLGVNLSLLVLFYILLIVCSIVIYQKPYDTGENKNECFNYYLIFWYLTTTWFLSGCFTLCSFAFCLGKLMSD